MDDSIVGKSVASDASHTIREILHLLVAPPSAVIRAVVIENLRSTDRLRWYPSLLLEGYERDRDLQQLADEARRLGVPLLTTRSRRGRLRADIVRTFLDEWFFARSTYSSLVHVHATPESFECSPARWLSPIIPRTPVVASLYRLNASNDAVTSVAIEVRRAGRLVWHRSGALREMPDTGWMYDAVLGRSR